MERIARALRCRLMALVILGVLVACGGTEPPARSVPREPLPPTGQPAAVVVAVEPAPPLPPPVEPNTDGASVRTVAGLLRAIRPNATIALEPGSYDLTTGAHITTEHVRWEEVFDGKQLVIEGVENVTIRAAREERPVILARPRYAWVMRLVNVQNVAFANLVLGHTPEGGCTGGVLGFEHARDVRIEGCELFGSGTVGLGLSHTAGFRFERSSVHDCTYGIAQIDHATDVAFRESRFEENREYDLVDVSASPVVRFERCAFARNRTGKGMGYVFFKTDRDSSVVLADSTFEGNEVEQLTNERSRLTVTGSGAAGLTQKVLAKPSPEYNQIYALARYQRWIVAATQAGVVFWDPAAGRVEQLVKAYISTGLVVQGSHLWVGSHRAILRFDGLTRKSYLVDENASGGRVMLGAGGALVVHQEKLVQLPDHWWQYDASRDLFAPITTAGPGHAPAALGGARYSLFYGALVRSNGEAWGVDFLRGLHQTKGAQTTSFARQSAVYPGRDPRQLYEDPRGRLWSIDFEDGFFRYDDSAGIFVADPTVTEKASDMVVDAQRNRTWLLHYTKGLHLVEPRQTQFFDLSRLQYMRALMLDQDGSVWVGGWNALVHLKRKGAQGWIEDEYEVDGSTVAPNLVP